MDDNQRIDLHTHTFLSDGVLLPSEQLRRAVVKGYGAIAITDHTDASNIDELLTQLLRFARQQRDDFPLVFLPGVELTHTGPASIAPLARRAKELGAALVVVHGETVVEPVAPGTNAANGVYLEITSRYGHGLANGHVARVAQAAGAKLLLNTDTHTPDNMIDQETAQRVAAAAGLDADGVYAATVSNPQAAVRRAQARLEALY
jgi:histidinol phosphatase-like PHP family hydrolase